MKAFLSACLSHSCLGAGSCSAGIAPPQPCSCAGQTLPVAIVIAAVLWLGYYDARVNGNPLTLPYTVDRATYAMAPYWIWQSPRPQPVYRHKIMQEFYTQSELSVVTRRFKLQPALSPSSC
jgi:hypothetical protein